MRLVQRVRTSASPAQVWEVLGRPARWPEAEPFLRRVRGTHEALAAGLTLVGVSRVASLTVPVDVLEVVPGRRLALRVHTAPGVRETVTFEVLPVLSGGSDVQVSVVVEGLFAPLAAAPVWLSRLLTVRLLAVLAQRLARAAGRAA